jgi:hypothetical protein
LRRANHLDAVEEAARVVEYQYYREQPKQKRKRREERRDWHSLSRITHQANLAIMLIQQPLHSCILPHVPYRYRHLLGEDVVGALELIVFY